MHFHLKEALKCLLLFTLFHENQVLAFTSPIKPSDILNLNRKSHQYLSQAQRISRSLVILHDSSSDPPNENNGSVWSALANTERWISETLNRAGVKGKSNPYSRKEVGYVCEYSDTMELVVAGIYRRLREVRELGENHAEIEKERKATLGDNFKPRTFRQTFVVIMPFCKEIVDSFPVFDNLINAINNSRRNARDYVTEISIERMQEDGGSFIDSDWSTSINMAQMHPKFGDLTPEQRLAEEMEKDQRGEVDLNYEKFKERRRQSRRSPYPTVVVEVKANPPVDYREEDRMQASQSNKYPEAGQNDPEEVTRSDLNKLEALFSQSATFAHPEEESADENESGEDAFYNAIAKTGIKEVTFINPINLAQNWVAENDPFYDAETSTFTSSPNKHVDEAYEFTFASIAMHLGLNDSKSYSLSQGSKGSRNYLILSNFLSSSATSFEKFTFQVNKIIDTIPNLRSKLFVSTFHPEHVEQNKRSPQPICVLEWNDDL